MAARGYVTDLGWALAMLAQKSVVQSRLFGVKAVDRTCAAALLVHALCIASMVYAAALQRGSSCPVCRKPKPLSKGRAEDKDALQAAAQAMNKFASDGSFMQAFQEQQQVSRSVQAYTLEAGVRSPACLDHSSNGSHAPAAITSQPHAGVCAMHAVQAREQPFMQSPVHRPQAVLQLKGQARQQRHQLHLQQAQQAELWTLLQAQPSGPVRQRPLAIRWACHACLKHLDVPYTGSSVVVHGLCMQRISASLSSDQQTLPEPHS